MTPVEKATGGHQCKYYPECIGTISKAKDDIICIQRRLEAMQLRMESVAKNGYIGRREVPDGSVSNRVFFWVIGVLVAILTGIQGYNVGQSEKMVDNIALMQQELSAMRTSIEYIKEISEKLSDNK